MRTGKYITSLALSSLMSLGIIFSAQAQDGAISAGYVKADVSNPDVNGNFWKKAKVFPVILTAQPIIVPRPEKTETPMVNVQAVHNGKWISFKFSWKDKDKSEGGLLGSFSDGVAMEFPVNSSDNTVSPFMGDKGKAVHIYHWKAAYQYDKDNGQVKTIKEIYPNTSVDLYPLEPKQEVRTDLKDTENYPKSTEEQRMAFEPGQAAGNPQSFPKLKAVDEIVAEGFSTSQVIKNNEGIASGEWKNGQWDVVISRPLHSKVGSVLEPGKASFIGFAVWQGGSKEVGSRKSVTLIWTPVDIATAK